MATGKSQNDCDKKLCVTWCNLAVKELKKIWRLKTLCFLFTTKLHKVAQSFLQIKVRTLCNFVKLGG
jgi:anthranilate phosphoribosyltransferase